MKPEEAKSKWCKNWIMEPGSRDAPNCIADGCMGWPQCKLWWELDEAEPDLPERIKDALIEIGRTKTQNDKARQVKEALLGLFFPDSESK